MYFFGCILHFLAAFGVSCSFENFNSQLCDSFCGYGTIRKKQIVVVAPLLPWRAPPCVSRVGGCIYIYIWLNKIMYDYICIYIYIYKLYVLNSGILGYSVFRQTQGICQQRWGFKNDLTSHILTGCPEEKSQFVHSKNDSRSNWENDTILADGEGSQFSPLEVVVVFHCYSIAILICPR